MLYEILLTVLAFASAVVSTLFGIAAGLIMLPFAATFIPIKEAVAFVTVYFIASNLNKIIMFWKYIDWKVSKLIYIGSIPFVILGAVLLVYAPSILLKKGLGLFILFYVLNEYFKMTKIRHLNNFGIVALSSFYGFVAGIIGAGGVVKAVLLNHLGMTKEKFAGTMAITAIVMNLIKTGIYSRFNLLNPSQIPLLSALIVAAFAGGYTGKYFLKKIKPETFRKAMLFGLFIISLYLIIF